MNWSTFLFAALDESLLNQKTLNRAFLFMGGENSGFLTKDQIRTSIVRRGHNLANQGNQLTVDEVVALAGDENVTLARLCELMGATFTPEEALNETPSTNVEGTPT